MSRINESPPAIPNKHIFKFRKTLLDNHSDKRSMIIRELVENETKFKDELCLVSYAMTSGKANIQISIEDFKAVRLNMKNIINSSSNLIQAICKSKQLAPDQSIKEACVAKYCLNVFQIYGDELVEYVKYFKPDLADKSPELMQYFTAISNIIKTYDDQGHSLTDYRMAIFQRLFKLRNLFSSLQKYTSVKHQDYPYVKSICELIELSLNKINEDKMINSNYNLKRPTSAMPIADISINEDICEYDVKVKKLNIARIKVMYQVNVFMKLVSDKTTALINFVMNRKNLLLKLRNLGKVIETCSPNISNNKIIKIVYPINTLDNNSEMIRKTSLEIIDRLYKLNNILKKPVKYFNKIPDSEKDSFRTKLVKSNDKRNAYIKIYVMQMEKLIKLSEQAITFSLLCFNSAAYTFLLQAKSTHSTINVDAQMLQKPANLISFNSLNFDIQLCCKNLQKQNSDFCVSTYSMTTPSEYARVKHKSEDKLKIVTIERIYEDFVTDPNYPLKVGDVVLAKQEPHSEWVVITTMNNDVGLYPSSYLS